MIIGYLTLQYGPVITQLVSEPEAFREVIQSHGETGVLVFIAFQVLQIVISVIPGEVVQIAGGYLYGVWLGTLYLLIGLLIGSVLVFYIARLLGYPVLRAFIPQAKFDKFRVLLKSRKFDLIVSFFFSLPGLPKDLLTYVAGFNLCPAFEVLSACHRSTPSCSVWVRHYWCEHPGTGLSDGRPF